VDVDEDVPPTAAGDVDITLYRGPALLLVLLFSSGEVEGKPPLLTGGCWVRGDPDGGGLMGTEGLLDDEEEDDPVPLSFEVLLLLLDSIILALLLDKTASAAVGPLDPRAVFAPCGIPIIELLASPLRPEEGEGRDWNSKGLDSGWDEVSGWAKTTFLLLLSLSSRGDS